MKRNENVVQRLVDAVAELQSAIGDLAAMISGEFSHGPVPDSRCGEYMSVRKLAEILPYSEQTIRNLMTSGELREGEHYYKRRGRVIFRWSRVEAWLGGKDSASVEGDYALED